MGKLGKRREDYDVIVIGAGIGGLIAGAYLARSGAKVLVCEQNVTPGGCFNSFKRNGYVFDGGIQGCENVGMLLPMLRQLGLESSLRLSKGKSAVATPDFFVPFPTYRQLADFYSHLESIYPEDAANLREISDDVQRLCRFFEAVFNAPNPFFQKSVFHFFAEMVGWLARHSSAMKEMGLFLRLLRPSVEDYLKSKLNDPRAAKMISQTIYRGSSAGYALPFFYFFTDYYYPRGGVQGIPDALAGYIKANGGEVRCKTLVEEIIYENGAAKGVRTKDGDEFRSRFVVCNGDFRRAFLKMLPEPATPAEFRHRLIESEVSESMFSVYLGVDIPPEKMPVQGCQHVLYLTSYDGVEYYDIENDPDYYNKSFIMMMIPSIEDPTLAPPGKSVVILQSAAVAEFGDNWGVKKGKKSKKYKEIKEDTAERMISNAEKIIPGLREKIEVQETASPYTYERYTLNSGGATGGWSKHLEKTFETGWKGLGNIFPPVKNLYMVGHWTSIPGGAPMGIITGKIVAEIVNLRLRISR